jgi:hypothetical protein
VTEKATHADAGPLGAYSDAARRISDNYRLHLTADPVGSEGRWMAFRLDDGECDKTLYASKSDAMRAKSLFARHWGFTVILPTGMDYRQAASYLRTCRMVAGNDRLRWMNTDTDAPEQQSTGLILPFRNEGNTRRIPLL